MLIANLEGNYPPDMPLKEVEFVIEEGSAEYYELFPKDI